MKKISKIIVFMAVILILIFITYSYFNVKGSEIKNVSNISSAKYVSITNTYPGTEIKEALILDSKQIEQLKKLILDSDFTRFFSSTVNHTDTDEYRIIVKFDDDFENDLSIDSIGNEYINVVNQFNKSWLRINNPNWQKTLEEIIGK